MNLYQIASEYELILSGSFNDDTGEISEGALEELERLAVDVKDKGIAIGCYIKNLEAEYKAVADAIENMAAREARLSKKMDALKNYLLTNMERCAITEISSPHFAIKMRKNPVSVHVFDESVIPQDYIKVVVKETRSIDKTKIKEEILSGVEVPGAALKQNMRIEIK